MKLLEEKRANRPMPTPVSKPDPPPERIVSGKEPTIGSSLLPSIESTLSDTTVKVAPTDSKKITTSTEPEKKTGSARGRKRRRGRSGKGDGGPGNSAKKTDQKPVASAADPQAGAEGATTEDGKKKTGRKRKRRRRRKKSGPKE